MVTERYANVPMPAVEEPDETDPVPTQGSLKRKAKEQRKVLGMLLGKIQRQVALLETLKKNDLDLMVLFQKLENI